MVLYVYKVFIHTLLTMAICMQDLDSVMLYALLRLPGTYRQSDSAKTQKESIYEAFTLATYGFW